MYPHFIPVPIHGNNRDNHHLRRHRLERRASALAFWSAGVHGVTTTVGPRGFTEEHLVALAACGVQRVVIAFPSGTLDDHLARLVAQALDAVDIPCARMCLPREVANRSALRELMHSAPEFRQSAEILYRESTA